MRFRTPIPPLRPNLQSSRPASGRKASGGQTGVNVDVAGFPNGGGDSPYFSTMIQGSPLYGSPSLSFWIPVPLLRFDDTVERVEIVQGGTGASRPRAARCNGEIHPEDGIGQARRLGCYTYGNEAWARGRLLRRQAD